MNKYWIKFLDPIESIMSEPLYKIIRNELSYKNVYFKQGPYQKIKKEYLKSTFIGYNKDGYYFYTGFIPRIRTFCINKKISLEEIGTETYGLVYKKPNVPTGFLPRTFQNKMAKIFIENERGVLIGPTGTGKTNLGLYVISCLNGLGNVLWLSHTKDLMHQSADEAIKWFGKQNVGRVGDDYLELGKFFTSATRQTFQDHVEEWGTNYDMVVLDEVQHLSAFPETNKEGKEINEYGQIFKRIFAPIRLGLTATMPDKIESKLAIEGLIGPILDEYTEEEAEKDGYIIKPTIKIIRISKSENLRKLRRYPDVYEWGVVRRLERNKKIIDLVEKHQKKNESVIIAVNKIVHGQLLEKLGLNRGLEIKFINGSTDTDTRNLTKQLLNDKKMKCVICTIWKEGTNIPELDVIINAGGEKSDLKSIQVTGRGRRKTETKNKLLLYDFFDPSHYYLLEHFGYRFSLYCERNWI